MQHFIAVFAFFVVVAEMVTDVSSAKLPVTIAINAIAESFNKTCSGEKGADQFYSFLLKAADETANQMFTIADLLAYLKDGSSDKILKIWNSAVDKAYSAEPAAKKLLKLHADRFFSMEPSTVYQNIFGDPEGEAGPLLKILNDICGDEPELDTQCKIFRDLYGCLETSLIPQSALSAAVKAAASLNVDASESTGVSGGFLGGILGLIFNLLTAILGLL